MKTVIYGSTTVKDINAIYKAVAASGFNVTEVISTGAQGASALGEEFAEKENISLQEFVPQWDVLGKSAAYRRNERLARYADCAIVVLNDLKQVHRHLTHYLLRLDKPMYVLTVGKDGKLRTTENVK